MIRTLLDSPHPFLKGITLERLDREHSVRLNISEDGAPFLPFAEGNFGTPDGKCHFDAETLDYEPPVESRHGDAALKSKYPLELISPKNDDSMNSTFGHRDGVDLATATLHLSEADAASSRHPPCRPGARVQRPRVLPADGQRGRPRARPAWSAPLPFAGASARATSATSTRSPAIGSPISAAAPPFTVAWYKWREAETDDTYTIVRTPRRGAPVLLPDADGAGAGAHWLQEQEGTRWAPPMRKRRRCRASSTWAIRKWSRNW